ncbi:hypothetical protein [Corynebacterium rouxii]|uniref:Uncharacterized protein n=1 Tax=Corynebacterium rouxii TaxID=2719119 RepID=A0ABU3PPX2_9CORY|nr:hypothetical protein [Corynebacterium rouxii]MDT9409624.1 hypothetical protein [Corynebacterium rouxii]MDT9411858.1 hypothetical protein [Corynebacterium rouxii]
MVEVGEDVLGALVHAAAGAAGAAGPAGPAAVAAQGLTRTYPKVLPPKGAPVPPSR